MAKRASAKRYAQATFDIALQRGQLDQWASDLGLVVEALHNAEFSAFLEHAKVPLAQKVQTIGEAFQGVDPMVLNLLSLLVSRGLAELVPEVEEGYRELLDQHKGREKVDVSSAVPLEDSEREQIIQFLTRLINKEVVLDSQVDPSILGGLVIKVGDRLIDGSTRTRLEGLGKELQR